MTGYQSKKAAALDKLAQPAQEPMCPECKAGVLYECVACSSNNYPPQGAQEPASVTYKEVADTMNALRKGNFSQKAAAEEVGKLKLYTAPPQREWVDLTHDEWFKCWLTLHAADETEAEIDFADFLIIVQAIAVELKEKNNG